MSNNIYDVLTHTFGNIPSKGLVVMLLTFSMVKTFILRAKFKSGDVTMSTNAPRHNLDIALFISSEAEHASGWKP